MIGGTEASGGGAGKEGEEGAGGGVERGRAMVVSLWPVL